VTRDDVGTQSADGERDGDEEARLHEHRYTHWHADAQQIADRRRVRAIETREEVQLAIVSARRHVREKCQRFDPQHARGCDAAA